MHNTSLSLDTKFLYGDASKLLISDQTVQSQKQHIAKSIAQVETTLSNGGYGFIETLKDIHYLDEVKNVYTNLQWAEYLVIVGIGGSDLGGRTIVEAFRSKNNPITVLFVGDSTDPVALARILDQVNLRKTVFNIISKSGGTLETLSTYLFFKQQVTTTTSKTTGLLKDEAAKHNVITLAVPEDVGGRFSVLTSVGLLPALALGLDCTALVKGALDFSQDGEARKAAQDLAKSQYELYKQGTFVSVMMVYSTQLQEFSRWYRQLWAESLGKEGKGILPIKAWGPADQHSQLQFYNQGSPLQSIMFIKIANRDINFTLRNIDIDQATYLEGVDFNTIINVEADATYQSLQNVGKPVSLLTIDMLTEKSLGELFMLFELAVVYLAQMIEVNAFDQPGVEESKTLIHKMLGKH
jgi:glucose-6-phosphate isomerase